MWQWEIRKTNIKRHRSVWRHDELVQKDTIVWSEAFLFGKVFQQIFLTDMELTIWHQKGADGPALTPFYSSMKFNLLVL